MFTAYHAIMFAVLLIGGAGVIFQASSGDDSLANNPIPVKGYWIKIRLKHLLGWQSIYLGALAPIFMDQVKTG